MRKTWKKPLAAAVALLLLVSTGCNVNKSSAPNSSGPSQSASSKSTQLDPFRKYPQVITLTAGQPVPAFASELPKGDTMDNNQFTRYFQSVSNIKVVDAFQANSGDAYNQKVKLAAASNDLPDMMVVSDYTLFKSMVEAGQVQDMTDAYNNGAWKVAKDIYSSGGGRALAMATFDGKLMALPDTRLTCNDQYLLWLRQDWMDKLNLPAPKTVDDVIAIAKAFIAHNADGKGDTVGLAGSNTIVNAFCGFDNIFHAYDSYPSEWIKDSSGKVVYGSVQPETKAALAKLAEMYREGVIDPQFAVRKDSTETISANQSGMFFGPFWAGWTPLPNSVKNDPKAVWKGYAVPLDANGKYNVGMEPPAANFLVAKKGTKDPNAVMEYFNLWARYERQDDPNGYTIYKSIPDLMDPAFMTPVGLTLDYVDALDRKYQQYTAVLNGKASISSLDGEGQHNVQAILDMRKNPPKEPGEGFEVYMSYIVGGAPLVNNSTQNLVYPAFYGQTDTMETKWASLQKLENESFLKIIMDKESPDYFDTFVKQWKALGGDQITAEIQDSSKK